MCRRNRLHIIMLDKLMEAFMERSLKSFDYTNVSNY